MINVTIKAYKYEELDYQSQFDVLTWLDIDPIDYQDEEGNIYCQYFTDMETQDVIDHCDANKYLFNKYGEPIHHLIVEA